MNGPLRCAIIEDEPLAQELLEKYIRRLSSLQLVATFDDAIVAFEQLPALRPEVIFLDINMPEMTGIEFLRAYPAPQPVVILTTANPNHALDGFELGVMDYLLKPITFDRFLKAVGRLKGKSDERAESAGAGLSVPAPPVSDPVAEPSSIKKAAEFIYLKIDGKLEQIGLDEIVFAEAMGDYLKVFLPDRYLVTHLTMTKLVESLPTDRFLRINRSYVVQLRHVKTLEGNTVKTSTGHELIVGPNYRDTVKDALARWVVG